VVRIARPGRDENPDQLEIPLQAPVAADGFVLGGWVKAVATAHGQYTTGRCYQVRRLSKEYGNLFVWTVADDAGRTANGWADFQFVPVSAAEAAQVGDTVRVDERDIGLDPGACPIVGEYMVSNVIEGSSLRLSCVVPNRMLPATAIYNSGVIAIVSRANAAPSAQDAQAA
jgi:hypothetical protein